MIVPDDIYQNNRKLFVTVYPKTHVNCYLLIIYDYHLLINNSQNLQFQQFSQIFESSVRECKHGISTNDRIKFNEKIENVSIEIIELTNIDESSHEEAIVKKKQNRFDKK